MKEMRAYAGNRIGLGVLGGVCLLAGAYAMARGRGLLLPDQPPGHRLPFGSLAEQVVKDARLRWLLALLLVVFALLVVRWLVRSLGWGRCGRRAGAGVAVLGVGLKEVEGLGRLGVRVVGEERLRVGISCTPDTDVSRLVAKLDGGVVSRVRREVGDDGLPTLVRLHVRRR